MATQTLMTAEQFDDMNRAQDRDLEFIDGEVIEVASSAAEHNDVLGNLIVSVRPFVRVNRIGNAIPETDCAMGNERVRPDLSIFLAAKWEKVDRQKLPVDVIPDIIAEVASRNDKVFELDRKIGLYLEYGVSEVWVLYPVRKHILVYSSPGVRELRNGDNLESTLLPGWSTPVAELFA